MITLISREDLIFKRVRSDLKNKSLGTTGYGPGASVFEAYAPAWRRDAQGYLVRQTLAIDDQWLRLAPGGLKALAELRRMV